MYVLALCLLVGLQAPGQPPAKSEAAAPVLATAWLNSYAAQAEAKPPSSLEQAITQALAQHPDMRLAEAEMRVAEAKMAQTRITVSQKVTEDFHRMEKERADVEVAKAKWDHVNRLHKKQMSSASEVQAAEHQLASAKARLASTESGWKLILGKQGNEATSAASLARYMDVRFEKYDANISNGLYRLQYQLLPEVVYSRQKSGEAMADSTIEQLKTHLETKVKLEQQNNLDLEQAFARVTTGAGLRVRVKLPITENKTIYKDVTHLNLDASEYPLRTWLQLIVDEMNNYQALSAQQRKDTPKRYELYVREYGLLLTSQDLAPPDAMTVQELRKQSEYEKAVKEFKKAQESEGGRSNNIQLSRGLPPA